VSATIRHPSMTVLNRIRAKANKMSSAEVKRLRAENDRRRRSIEQRGGYENVAKKSVIGKLSDDEIKTILQV